VSPDETPPPKLDLLTVPRQIDALIERTGNPRHRAILRNYRRHVLLELAGRWPEILTPEMTVARPVYRSVTGSRTTVYDGPARSIASPSASR
jgi:hypothetical protein